MSQEIDLFVGTYRPLSFNYIGFWGYLNLRRLENMILEFISVRIIDIKKSKGSILPNLFIDGNMKFTDLDIIHPIYRISGTEGCFSKLNSLICKMF